MRPEALALLREVDRLILFEDAHRATRSSVEDPSASFWACSSWRGRGKHREPCEWKGYVRGLWCMTVRRARRGLFYGSIHVHGVTTRLRPCTTGVVAQKVAYEALLASMSEGVPAAASARLPYKPRRKPKTPEANEAAKAKVHQLEEFRSAFHQKFRVA